MTRRKQNVNKKSTQSFFSWKWFFISLCVLGLFLLIFKIFFLSQTAKVRRQLSIQEMDIIRREKINLRINDIILKYGIKDDWISQRVDEKVVKIPGSVPTIQLCQEIANDIQKYGAEIWKSHEDIKTEAIILEIGYKKQLLQNLRFVKDHRLEPVSGKIALIIDDFGYHNSEIVDEFLTLNIPLTISIIPGLEFSVQIAEQAVLYKKDVLIHLPMEPLDEPIEDHGFTLLTSQSDVQILERIKHACEVFPAAVGLNNHQGSKAMADKRIVKILMDELKRQQIFFIDSRTCKNTLGYTLAKRANVPTAKRDVFIDNEDDEKQIQDQILKLATKARKQGAAIGIGHVRPGTLSALKKTIEEFQLLGFQFVYVSQLVK